MDGENQARLDLAYLPLRDGTMRIVSTSLALPPNSNPKSRIASLEHLRSLITEEITQLQLEISASEATEIKGPRSE